MWSQQLGTGMSMPRKLFGTWMMTILLRFSLLEWPQPLMKSKMESKSQILKSDVAPSRNEVSCSTIEYNLEFRPPPPPLGEHWPNTADLGSFWNCYFLKRNHGFQIASSRRESRSTIACKGSFRVQPKVYTSNEREFAITFFPASPLSFLNYSGLTKLSMILIFARVARLNRFVGFGSTSQDLHNNTAGRCELESGTCLEMVPRWLDTTLPERDMLFFEAPDPV